MVKKKIEKENKRKLKIKLGKKKKRKKKKVKKKEAMKVKVWLALFVIKEDVNFGYFLLIFCTYRVACILCCHLILICNFLTNLFSRVTTFQKSYLIDALIQLLN